MTGAELDALAGTSIETRQFQVPLLGHELETILVGFVEDLALERGRS